MATMDAVLKALEDMKTTMTQMNSTMETLAPLAPSVADLAALPGKVSDLQKSMKDAGDHLQSVSVAVKRLESGDRSSGSSNQNYRPPPMCDSKLKGAADDDGVLGSPPPVFSTPPIQPLQQPRVDQYEEDRFLKPKMVFPSFDGTCDPLPWLNRCELYFRGHNTPEHRKVWMASLHMTDAAQLWYYHLETVSGEPDWRRFKQLLHKRFGPGITESPLGEMALLRCTGSVEEYSKQFVSLACRDVELSERQQVQLFIAGLNNPLKTDVAIHSPPTLDDAIRLARAYEQRLAIEPAQGRAGGRPPFRPPGLQGAAAVQGVAPAPNAQVAVRPPAAARIAALPRRQLTPTEMAQRRADGLCFNCPEKYFAGHRCKQLAVIEIVPDNEDLVDQEDEDVAGAELHFLHAPPAPLPEGEQSASISLHALTGIDPPDVPTMYVWVFLGARRLTALLDSGSSKTFINTRVAEELRIPVYPDQALKVTVGNGDQVLSPGRLAEVRGMVGGDYFWFDSHSLPMGSLDMVIGVSWMSQLGDISWNFREQTFAFRVADKRIMWCGINRPGPASLRSMSRRTS